MDEHARRAEREAARDGSASARVRLAHAHRRSGRWADVLAATEGLAQPDALAVRAEALLGAGRLDDAADAAGAARAADPEAVGPDLAAELARALVAAAAGADAIGRLAALARASRLGPAGAPALAAAAGDPDPLVRAQAARVADLAPALVDDPAPLVRFVARRTPALGEAALRALCTQGDGEEVRNRLFSAHGPDYEFGPFVLFFASGEARFSFVDLELFRAVDRLLGGPIRWLGFSKVGYGLGVPAHARSAGDRLEEDVQRLDAAGVLPFPVQFKGLQPFDVLDDLAPGKTGDELLCANLVRDLTWHPVRRSGAAPDAPVHQRIAAALRPTRTSEATPTAGELEAMLAEARAAYTPVGARALELFVRGERDESRDRGWGRARSAEKAGGRGPDDGRS